MTILFAKTEDFLAPHHLMELFQCDDDSGEYDGPDLDECDVVQVCEGEWRLEPDGELWRFWKLVGEE
jgi:hypothetical protein